MRCRFYTDGTVGEEAMARIKAVGNTEFVTVTNIDGGIAAGTANVLCAETSVLQVCRAVVLPVLAIMICRWWSVMPSLRA
jgi:hypothetical protein